MQGSTGASTAGRAQLSENPEQHDHASRPQKPGYLLAGLILVALLGSVAHYRFGFSHVDFSGHAWGCDDAYISYRYAVNLARGDGLVFNPGERVEGYSNFLYTLFAAALASVDRNLIYTGCVVFNLLMYVLTVVLLYWYVKKSQGDSQALAACLVFCLCPVLWAWPGSGLETSAVIFVQLALFITADLASRNTAKTVLLLFACLSGLAVLLRADGFVFPLLCTSVFLMRGRYRRFWGMVAFIATASVLYAGARFLYYGDIWPNTYHVKITGLLLDRLGSAGKQLGKISVRDGFFLYLFPLACGWRPFYSRLRRGKLDISQLPAIPVVGLGLLSYWFYIGGDVFLERFLLVLIPLGIVHLLSKEYLIPLRWKGVGLACFVMIQLMPFAFDSRFDYRYKKYDRWIELGQYLAVRYPKATLAVDAAGKIPFFSGLRTIDMLGLTDAHISRKPITEFHLAHSKYDPDYVLSREPDLIAAWGTSPGDMIWGMSREKYLPKGYTIKYVVNAYPESQPQDIIDVAGWTGDKIAALYPKGYRYFVLLRQPVSVSKRHL